MLLYNFCIHIGHVLSIENLFCYLYCLNIYSDISLLLRSFSYSSFTAAACCLSLKPEVRHLCRCFSEVPYASEHLVDSNKNNVESIKTFLESHLIWLNVHSQVRCFWINPLYGLRKSVSIMLQQEVLESLCMEGMLGLLRLHSQCTAGCSSSEKNIKKTRSGQCGFCNKKLLEHTIEFKNGCWKWEKTGRPHQNTPSVAACREETQQGNQSNRSERLWHLKQGKCWKQYKGK